MVAGDLFPRGDTVSHRSRTTGRGSGSRGSEHPADRTAGLGPLASCAGVVRFSPSTPFLNSLLAWPRDWASFGSWVLPKSEEDDDQDDEELRGTEVHGVDPFEGIAPALPRRRPWPPRRRGPRRAVEVVEARRRRTAPPRRPRIRVSTPSARPRRGLLPHLLDRADQPTRPATRRGSRRRAPPAARASRRRSKRRARSARPRRRARRARASASTVAGITARPRRTRGRAPSSRSRYAVGRPHPARVPAVGELGHERSSRSPLPPTNTGGARLLHRRRIVDRAVRRGGSVPSTVHGPPPSSPRTTSIASREPRQPHARATASSIPMASYSGSYQPAPSPTSSRPPQIRSRVASAFASTAAGRSASHSTSVPSRTRGTSRASAASVTIGSYDAVRGRADRRTSRRRGRGGPTARASRTRGASASTAHSTTVVPRQRGLARDREVVLRQRETDTHRRGTLPVRAARSAVPCCGARVRAERVGGARPTPCSTRLLGRVRRDAARRARRPPTTTARCSRSPAPSTDASGGALARPRRRTARRPASTHAGVHPRLGALDVVPFVALAGTAIRVTRSAAAREFAPWIGADARASRCSSTTHADPDAPHAARHPARRVRRPHARPRTRPRRTRRSERSRSARARRWSR